MKLQIDTTNKTITIEEPVNLGELYEMLSQLFLNFTWKEYKLLATNSLQQWRDPIVIPWLPVPMPWYTPIPLLPSTPSDPNWGFPVVTCVANSTDNSASFTTNKAQNSAIDRNTKTDYETKSVYNLIINKE